MQWGSTFTVMKIIVMQLLSIRLFAMFGCLYIAVMSMYRHVSDQINQNLFQIRENGLMRHVFGVLRKCKKTFWGVQNFVVLRILVIDNIVILKLGGTQFGNRQEKKEKFSFIQRVQVEGKFQNRILK